MVFPPCAVRDEPMPVLQLHNLVPRVGDLDPIHKEVLADPWNGLRWYIKTAQAIVMNMRCQPLGWH